LNGIGANARSGARNPAERDKAMSTVNFTLAIHNALGGMDGITLRDYAARSSDASWDSMATESMYMDSKDGSRYKITVTRASAALSEPKADRSARPYLRLVPKSYV
jgi:hypothetical protein